MKKLLLILFFIPVLSSCSSDDEKSILGDTPIEGVWKYRTLINAADSQYSTQFPGDKYFKFNNGTCKVDFFQIKADVYEDLEFKYTKSDNMIKFDDGSLLHVIEFDPTTNKGKFIYYDWIFDVEKIN